MDENNDTSPSGSGEGAGPPPPPPLPPDPRPRPLTRAGTGPGPAGGAVLGGVAAGLARYLNVDPLLVRLGFIAAALLGGAGVIVYLIAWLMIPVEGPAADPPRSGAIDRAVGRIQRAPTWAQVLGILLVVVLVAGGGGLPPDVAWAAVLVLGGVLLFRASDRRDTAAAGPGAVVPAQQVPPPPHTAQPAGSYASGWGAAPASPYATTEQWAPIAPPAAKEPRQPALLARMIVALLLLAAGTLALLEQAGVLSLRPRHYVGGALLVVGVALLVGAWLGRARPLIWLGLLLLPALFVATLPAIPLSGGIGERVHTPASPSELQPAYELGAGVLVLDLTEVTGREPIEVDLHLGLGELRVLVPEGADVELEGSLRGGEAAVLGSRRNGASLDLSELDPPAGRGRRIVLDVEHGFGLFHVAER